MPMLRLLVCASIDPMRSSADAWAEVRRSPWRVRPAPSESGRAGGKFRAGNREIADERWCATSCACAGPGQPSFRDHQQTAPHKTEGRNDVLLSSGRCAKKESQLQPKPLSRFGHVCSKLPPPPHLLSIVRTLPCHRCVYTRGLSPKCWLGMPAKINTCSRGDLRRIATLLGGGQQRS